uniref:Putative secreted protein n=1 Tax=Anopheles marajoara TaxID=58244 RepID=A0A2M4CBF9_9DIPT
MRILVAHLLYVTVQHIHTDPDGRITLLTQILVCDQLPQRRLQRFFFTRNEWHLELCITLEVLRSPQDRLQIERGYTERTTHV